jgi:RimJ/RimL family protein N-acetyltransferase
MGNLDVTIRKATEDDAGQVLRYLKRLGGESDNLSFGNEGIGIPLEKEKEYLKAMSGDDSCMYFAFKGEEVVGCAELSRGRRRMEHRAEMSIGILRSVWGTGLSMRLFSLLREWALSHGVSKINLEVREDNLRAKAFYAKLGFHREGATSRLFRIDGTYVNGEYWGLEL